MKQINVVKTGSLKAKDPAQRGAVATLEVPEYPMGPEDVKIKVAYCAVCGSDPHLVEGIFGWETPFGLGHEVSGVVVELGEKATQKGLKIGDRVAGNFLKFCGICYYCQNGQEQFCEHAGDYNRAGMSETIVWHESQVYRLPDSVSLKQGCLLEPVSIAVRMMDKVQPKLGMRIAVNGGGPIGLLGIQAFKMMGATDLTLIEPIAERRALAARYGADHVIDPTRQDLAAETAAITEGRGFDVVVDCSGFVGAVSNLPPLVARGGMLLYGAMYPNDFEMPLNLYQYCYFNELTISGYYVAPYCFPRAAQILERFDLSDFVGQVYDIDDAEAAFAAQVSGKYPKILIRCNKIEGE